MNHPYTPDPALIPGLRNGTIMQIVVGINAPSMADHYGFPLWDAAWVDGEDDRNQYLQLPYSEGTTHRLFPPHQPGDTMITTDDFYLHRTNVRAVQVDIIPPKKWVWIFTVERIEE